MAAQTSEGYVSLEEALGGLDFEPAGDFFDVAEEALRIQRFRGEQKASSLGPGNRVSRSTLLAASYRTSRLVADQLDEAGLDRAKFEDLIGLIGFEQLPPAEGEELFVGPRFVESLWLLSNFQVDQPLQIGAIAIAYAAVSSAPDGPFSRRFEQAGGDARDAAARLEKELLRPSSASTSTVNFNRLDLTDEVIEALLVALAIAEQRNVLVGSSELFQGALAVGKHKSSGAFAQLRQFAEQHEIQRSVALQSREALAKIPLYPAVETYLAATMPLTGGDFGQAELVTLALLAGTNDWVPDSVLSRLRVRWFRYLVTEEARGDADQWRLWWAAAGVDPPPLQMYLYYADHGSDLELDVVTGSTHTLPAPEGNPAPESGDGMTVVVRRDQGLRLVGRGTVLFSSSFAPDEMLSQAADTDPGLGIKLRYDHLGPREALSVDDWPSLLPGLETLASIRLVALSDRHAAVIARLFEPTPEAQAPLAFLDADAVPMQGRHERSDLTSKDRLLEGDQARDLAALAILDDIKPPLALGLLGDWGVGKTFFMRMMQEAIDSVAGPAPRQSLDGAVKRVAQIEFNAWHYVDADLWASLANHIFDSLAAEISTEDNSVPESRRRLRTELETSKRRLGKAQATKESLEISRDETAVKLAKRRREREKENHELVKLWDKRFWTHAKADEWLKSAKSEIESGAKIFGTDLQLDSLEDLERATTQFSNARAGMSELWMALPKFIRDWGWPQRTAGLLAVVALLLFVQQMGGALFRRLGASDSLSVLQAAIVESAALVALGSSWVLEKLSKFSKVRASLIRVKDELVAARRVSAEPSEEETAAIGKLAQLEAEIENLAHQIDRTEQQVVEVEAEIERINHGGLVYDFLGEKASDSRYRDRLGLISLIRQDFLKLAKLLVDWAERSSDDSLAVERIVLYIDDLDRCPPERVVEVLQAVHLLLAFDLFVVVVAVDTRWLESSLNTAYEKHQKEVFSAQNYLEKIFQVTFTISAMREEGYRRLVSALVETPRTNQELKDSAKKASTPATPSPDPAEAGPKEEAGEEVQTPLEEDSHAPTDTSDGDSATPEPEDPQPEKKEVADDTQRRVKSMLLTDAEVALLKCLHPFVHTPRVAKRLVNIYRLVRVRAIRRCGASDWPHGPFIDGSEGHFRAVLISLAIGLGRDVEGTRILNHLEATTSASLDQWLRGVGQECSLAPESAEALLGDLATVRAALGKISSQVTVDDDLASYRLWSADVRRFLFQWSPPADSASGEDAEA